MAVAKKTKKRKSTKNLDKGAVHIQASFNNTMVTFTDATGNTVSWSSAGSLGFKGSRKSTPFAAQQAVEAAAKTAKEQGISVPEEMEIICVYDSKHNSMARPQISAFKIPDYDLGAVAMRVMTKMLHDENEIIDKEIELSYIYTARKTTK